MFGSQFLWVCTLERTLDVSLALDQPRDPKVHVLPIVRQTVCPTISFIYGIFLVCNRLTFKSFHKLLQPGIIPT